MADEVVTPPIETKPEKQNLTQVIEKAATDVAKQVGDAIEQEEKDQKVKPTDKSNDDKDTKTGKDSDKSGEPKDEFSEEQVNFAKTLYKALNNPDIAIQKQTLKILATAAGLDLKEVETKIEVKEAQKDLVALLKEGLGEFDFLADKLGPVLEKALKAMVAEETKTTKDELRNIQLEKSRELASKGIDSAFGKYENATTLANEVKSLQDKYPPSKNVSTEEYFTDLLHMAAARKGVELVKVGVEKKIVESKNLNKNRSDVGTRLSTERGAEVKLGIKTPGKMNLNEAVRSAIETLAVEKE